MRVRSDGDQGVLSDRQVVELGAWGAKPTLGKAAGQDPQGNWAETCRAETVEREGEGQTELQGTSISGCLFGSVFSSVRARTLRELYECPVNNATQDAKPDQTEGFKISLPLLSVF